MIEIAGRKIGPGQPAYVIAELSANHNQDYGKAVDLLKAAVEAGADAVKLQSYSADTLTIDCDNDYFKISGESPWAGQTLYELYKGAAMPWEWHVRLKEEADRLKIPLFSTPFDNTAVDLLEELGVAAYKIASYELVHNELLERVAVTGKPVILSTGMATLAEIDEAVTLLRSKGTRELALLKCTSSYPALPEEMNLKTIANLAETFDVVAGLSDHSLSPAVPLTAVVLGASIIEKHLTISRSDPGPDTAFSLEPQEFRQMVEGIRTAEQAVGTVSYDLQQRERASRVFRRSIFVVKDMSEGEIFKEDNTRVIRPGYGMLPRFLPEVLGRKARKPIGRGTPLTWDLID